VSARGVSTDICCFYVEPVRAVSVLACIPAAGEPEAVDAGCVGVVLACSWRVDRAEARFWEESGAEVSCDSPGDHLVCVADQPPAYEGGGHGESVPGWWG
jgi:hypothetical protein